VKAPSVLDPLIVEAVARRRAMGRTQTSIADEIGVTQSSVSELETGTATPNIRTMRRYLRALGLDLAIVSVDESVIPP
jgi:transcriptional regulator with XRE-family HTH domain